jgi:hypothetical protein
VFECPPVQRRERSGPAGHPDPGGDRTGEHDVDHDAVALLVDEPRTGSVIGTTGDAAFPCLGQVGVACAREDLRAGVLDLHGGAEEIAQRGRDAGDPARADRDPEQPLVDLLRARHEGVLVAQVVEHPRRGDGDGRVLGQ